jgi:WD40 repeat protein
LTNLPDCLLSGSDDGTSRIWDLRINKGIVLLQHANKEEIACAKFGVVNCAANIVTTAQGNSLNFFDVRKPSLVLKSIKSSSNSDDINEIAIALD